jgi:hypothetical protein
MYSSEWLFCLPPKLHSHGHFIPYILIAFYKNGKKQYKTHGQAAKVMQKRENMLKYPPPLRKAFDF